MDGQPVMIVQDPRSPGTIDVTGWDLDTLQHELAELAADHLMGIDRPLTEDEVDTLTGEESGLLPLSAEVTWRGWHLQDPPVGHAIERLREIVDEALHQRDLPRAIAKKHEHPAGTLTPTEARAWDRHVRDIEEQRTR